MIMKILRQYFSWNKVTIEKAMGQLFGRDSVLPKGCRWKQTSSKELEETDTKILDAIPCIKERRFVDIGNCDRLWSIVCNPEKRGTPLVMVHGMGGGVGLWSLNLEALSEARPVYAFDLLGFGRSSRPDFSSNPKEVEDKFVQSIEGYRKAMGLDQFILLGHSLGGYLSASYCLRYPQHVRHLIMVDPWGMNERPKDKDAELSFFLRMMLHLSNTVNPMSILRAAGPYGPKLVKYYRPKLALAFGSKLGDDTLLHDYIYHCNAQKPSGEVGFKSLSFKLGWAKEPMIQRINGIDTSVPITFINGSYSWVDRSMGWKLKATREGYVDVQIVRGAGHHVYADRAELFNRLVGMIAVSVDGGRLPSLDSKLVKRLRSAPSHANLDHLSPADPDMEAPLGHIDENVHPPQGSEEQGEGDDQDLDSTDRSGSGNDRLLNLRQHSGETVRE